MEENETWWEEVIFMAKYERSEQQLREGVVLTEKELEFRKKGKERYEKTILEWKEAQLIFSN